MSTSSRRSRSTRSSRKSSTGMRRSDGSALRKSVLKNNHAKKLRRAVAEKGLLPIRRTASPRSTRRTAVFEMTEDLRIQMKRVVVVTATHVSIFNAINILHDSMNNQQYDTELMRQASVGRKQSYYDQRPAEDNPMEKINQTVRYSQRCVRIERDVAIDKKYLDSVWETSDCRGVIDGFKTVFPDGRESLADVKTTSMSSNIPKGGFKSTTAIVITFDQDANSPDPAKLVRNNLKRREDAPCLEDDILMNATVQKTGFELKILQEVHLKPAVWLLQEDSWVEEQRLYRYSPVEGKMIELDKSFKLSPSVKTPTKMLPSATSQTHSSYRTPTRSTSRDSTVFYTPQMTPPSAGIKWDPSPVNIHVSPPMPPARPAIVERSSVYPIAIPGLQVHKREPRAISRGVLQPSAPANKSPERVANPGRTSSISPASNKRSSASLSVDQQLTPKMEQEEMKEASPAPQKHTLTMAAEIGGEAYEFQGNIVFGPKDGPQELNAKRVLVDGKELWTESTDWNPSSLSNSVMTSPKVIKK